MRNGTVVCSNEVALVVSGNFTKSPVDFEVDTFDALQRHSGGGGSEYLAEAFFAGTQIFLGPPMLRDVGDKPGHADHLAIVIGIKVPAILDQPVGSALGSHPVFDTCRRFGGNYPVNIFQNLIAVV